MEFALIEDSKENVQPLASGRDAAVLARQLQGLKAQPTSDTCSIFKEACKDWEGQLENYSGDDPLAVWDDYIRWAQQNATSDKLMALIVPLLQRCTRQFQNDANYKEDPRYLRIWIKYIDTVKDPSDVFAFLEANGIGTNLALFYTSWALAMELKKGMYAEAYAKIEEGINKKAEPEEKLRLALKQFQHRMNQRTVDAITKNQTADPAPVGREFGDQLSKGRKVVRQAAPSGATQGVSRRPGVLSDRGATVAGTGNKAGFSIFCDSDAGAGAPAAQAGGSWNYLPGEGEKTKENVRKASQWTKESAGTLPQRRRAPAGGVGSGTAVPKAGVDFELFVDEGLGEEAAEGKGAREGARPVRLQLEGEAGKRRDREAEQRQAAPLEFLSGGGAGERGDGTGGDAAEEEEASAGLGFRLPLSHSLAPSESGRTKEGASKGKGSEAGGGVGSKPRAAVKEGGGGRKDGGGGGIKGKGGRGRSEDGTGVAGYDRQMLMTEDGEVLSIEEAHVLRRYGVQHWEGTFDFESAAVYSAAVGAGSDADEVMEEEEEEQTQQERGGAERDFSPTKPLSMTAGASSQGSSKRGGAAEDGEKQGLCNLSVQWHFSISPPPRMVFETIEGRPSHYPDQTQPSPTFSQFANTSKTAAFLIPASAAPSQNHHHHPLPLAAAEHSFKTPMARSLRSGSGAGGAGGLGEEQGEKTEPQTLSKFGGNDLSAISKGQSFLANSSRHTLCPENNFTLHEPTASVLPHTGGGGVLPFIEAEHPFIGDENVRPAQLTFTNEAGGGAGAGGCCFSPVVGAGSGPGSNDFFLAAASAVSPTLNTRNAQNCVLDLMPSPTQTARPFRPSGKPQQQFLLGADSDSGPAHTASASGGQDGQLAGGGGVGGEAGGAACAVSPTVNTKFAREQALDLMPSPTATLQFVSSGGGMGGGFEVREDTSVQGFMLPAGEERGLGGAGGFMIREDTACAGGGLGGGAGGGFVIREDTALVGCGIEAQGQASPPPAAAAGGGGGGGFVIREDTGCAPPAAASGSGGFMIREDTECAGLSFKASEQEQEQEQEMREGNVPAAGGAMMGDAGGGGGLNFEIREDTAPFHVPPAAVRPVPVEEAAPPTAASNLITDENACADARGSGQVPKRRGLRVLADSRGEPAREAGHQEPPAEATAEEPGGAFAAAGGGGEGGSFLGAGMGVGRELSRIGEVSVVGGGGDSASLKGEASGEAEIEVGGEVLGAEVGAEAEELVVLDEGGGGKAAEEEEDIPDFMPSPTQTAPAFRPPLEQPKEQMQEVPDFMPSPTQTAPPAFRPLEQPQEHMQDELATEDQEFKVGGEVLSAEAEELVVLDEGGGGTVAEEEEAMPDFMPSPTQTAAPAFRPLEQPQEHMQDELVTDEQEEVVVCGGEVDFKVGGEVLSAEAGAEVEAEAEELAVLDEGGGGKAAEEEEDMPDFMPSPTQTAPAFRPLEQPQQHMQDELAMGGNTEEEEVVDCRDKQEEEEEQLVVCGGDQQEEEVLVARGTRQEEEKEEELVVLEEGEEEGKGEEELVMLTEDAEEGRAHSAAMPEEERAEDGVEVGEHSALEFQAPVETSGCSERGEGEADGGGGRRGLRQRAAVSYKEPPINVKCRQGANPWASSSLNTSSSSNTSRASLEGQDARSGECSGGGKDQVDGEGVLLAAEGGVIEPLSAEHTELLANKTRALLKGSASFSCSPTEDPPAVRVGSKLELGGMLFHTEAVLGKGGWSTVYKLRRVRTESLKGALEDLDSQSLSALKVLSYASSWELHVSTRIHREVEQAARSSLLELQLGAEFSGSTLLLADYSHQHSLQDVINAYRKSGKKMEEHVVFFYAIELLRVVEQLHDIGMLHGDLKPDNIMIRDDDQSQAEWEYAPRDGFSSKGVMLIDYGCAIDRRLYPEGASFRGRSRTSSFECPEMQAEEPWVEHVDHYAVASAVHCLLHADYMALDPTPAPGTPTTAQRFMPKLPLKRYWQVDTWTSFFDLLINGSSNGPTPKLGAVRAELANYFEGKGAAKRGAMRMALIKQSILLDQYAPH